MSETALNTLPSEQRDAVLQKARRLWDAALPLREIAAEIGVTYESLHSFTKNHAGFFPPRQKGWNSGVDASIARREARTQAAQNLVADGASRLGRAFLPLPGSYPESFLSSRANGCKWPVDPELRNPLDGPVMMMCCNGPRVIVGDKLRPYCEEHVRMSCAAA